MMMQVPDLIAVDHHSDLAGFELVEDDLLTSLPAYQLYLERTKQGFAEIINGGWDIEIRPYQWEYAALMAVRRRNVMAYEQATGKAQPLTSLVYTPTGPKVMGELQTGDRVLTPSNETATVIGVYPQGIRDIYKVTFSDGSFTHCCKEHLWAVRTPVRVWRNHPFEIRNLEEISRGIRDARGGSRHFIPITKPIDFDAQDVPLNPYLLGVILGDGSIRKASVIVTNPEIDLMETIRPLCPENIKVVKVETQGRCPSLRLVRKNRTVKTNVLNTILRNLGLTGKRSYEKFVPKEYLYNTAEVRLSILQGLLDTDGFVEDLPRMDLSTPIEYSTSSYQLAKDVQFIVESLGGTCSLKERVPKYTYKGERLEGRTSYRLNVKLPVGIMPFRLARKLNKYHTSVSHKPRRTVYSIELVGQEECQCIAIDHPSHLYLTDHCIVTHNTTVTLLALKAIYRTFHNRRAGSIHILVPNLLSAQRWIEELNRFPSMTDHWELIKNERSLDECTKPIIIYTLDFPKNKSKHRKGSARPYISRRLVNFQRPSVLIVDEVHNCQANTQRTAQVKYLIQRARRVIVLTGTPSEGNLSEIHNLCSLVYGHVWPFSSSQAFSKRFGTKEQISTNYLYGSRAQEHSKTRFLQKLDSEKLQDYYSLIKRFIHRVKLTDPQVASCITIPSSNTIVHKLEPTIDQQIKHLDYTLSHQKALLAAANAVGIQQKAEALKLLYPLISLCNNNESSPKLTKTGEIVTSAAGKVVIFCSYIKSAGLITNYLCDLIGSEHVVRVYASDEDAEVKALSNDRRVELVDQFQYDDDVQVGVFAINLASESINLTAASDVVYFCLPWSVKKLRQSMYRSVRPGNKHKEVNLHYLYHRGLVDEHQVVLATQKLKSSRLLEDYEVGDVGEESVELTYSDVLKRLLSAK